MSDNDETTSPTAPEEAETEPQVFAVSHTEGETQFTRRQFVQLAALVGSASALSGCATPDSSSPAATSASPNEKAAPSVPPSKTRASTEAPVFPDAFPTPTRTRVQPTEMPSPTPTALPQCVVRAASVNFRSGPGVTYTIIGALKKGMVLNVLARNPDGTWLNVETETGQTGWVALSVLENLSVEVTDLPLAKNIPTPAATARAAQPAGQPTDAAAATPARGAGAARGRRGPDYDTGEWRNALPALRFTNSGRLCLHLQLRAGLQLCRPSELRLRRSLHTCDRVCTCESVGHYWHPN